MRVISRNPSSAKGKLQYPGLEFFALNDIERAVQGADAVVNLAGEPISTRWGLVRQMCCVTYNKSRQ